MFPWFRSGVSCVQFDENRIVSGSSDKTIKVWTEEVTSTITITDIFINNNFKNWILRIDAKSYLFDKVRILDGSYSTPDKRLKSEQENI